jgi:hypothetical protein
MQWVVEHVIDRGHHLDPAERPVGEEVGAVDPPPERAFEGAQIEIAEGVAFVAWPHPFGWIGPVVEEDVPLDVARGRTGGGELPVEQRDPAALEGDVRAPQIAVEQRRARLTEPRPPAVVGHQLQVGVGHPRPQELEEPG